MGDPDKYLKMIARGDAVFDRASLLGNPGGLYLLTSFRPDSS